MIRNFGAEKTRVLKYLSCIEDIRHQIFEHSVMEKVEERELFGMTNTCEYMRKYSREFRKYSRRNLDAAKLIIKYYICSKDWKTLCATKNL